MPELPDPRPLWSLGPGESGSVASFGDILSEPYRIRLMELGFHPGETISCLLAPGLGAPRVYRVSNTVFSLDEDLAGHVMVNLNTPSGGAR